MMHKRDCIFVLAQGARVRAARHMRFDSLNDAGTTSDSTRVQSATHHTRAFAQRARSHRRAHRMRRLSSCQTICGSRLDVPANRSARRRCEEVRWRKRQTLAGSWHRNQRRRQRCTRNLMLQRCSRCGKHRAPASRHGARRRVDQMQPPRDASATSVCLSLTLSAA